ncbi:MAG: hypothetical protein ACQERZ_06685 [Fusobacteriota bacterium]
MSRLKNYNEYQIKLMKDSKLSKKEWIEKYGEKFNEISKKVDNLNKIKLEDIIYNRSEYN